MTKVLWFSRHDLTDAQFSDLVEIYGEIEVVQINRTINSAYEIKAEIEESNVVAIVAPLNLQDQFLKLADKRPVLICRNHRIPQEDGTMEFVHGGWSQLKKVEIIIEELTNHPAPENTLR